MDEGTFQRRLAAILYADVAGYSRLTGKDELGTHQALRAGLDLVATCVGGRRGRVVHYAGDAVLAEFPSVVEAIHCAVDAQTALARYNESLAEADRLEFRIGVNLGDVMVDGAEIYGDGVNIAARLESLAPPGGICVSQTVYDQVRKLVDLRFEDLGNRKVKNITEPVRVFRVLWRDQGRRPYKRLRILGTAAFLVASVAFIVWTGWWMVTAYSRFTPATEARMVHPLPDRPSIAVLPFEPIGTDPDTTWYARGLTDNLVTALGTLPSLFLVTFDKAWDAARPAADPGGLAERFSVRYLLRGGVQKEGETIRVTVRLADALEGHHVWTDRFDRPVSGLFALQDEITRRIAVAILGELSGADQERLRTRTTEDLQAWLTVQRARNELARHTREANARGRELLERAITLDAEYADAWRLLAGAHLEIVRTRWSDDPEVHFAKAFDDANRAHSLDDSLPDTSSLLALLHLYRREFDRALELAERALELGPSSADNVLRVADIQRYAGDPSRAVRLARKAMRLNPAFGGYYLYVLGVSLHHAGRFDEAVSMLEELLARNPTYAWGNAFLADSYRQLGEDALVRRHVAAELRVNPGFSLAWMRRTAPYRDRELVERIQTGMRAAGLPERSLAQAAKSEATLAVLPFANPGGDPEREYFSDGITEDLITSLSKLPGLLVVSRHGAFRYKGRTADPRQVGRELDVRYVLEGSVRRSGDRVRVTTQLVDTQTGFHVWAERYDRDFADIFAVQDEITASITDALSIELSPGDRGLRTRHTTDDPEAYALLLQSRVAYRRWTPASNAETLKLLEQALERDPEFAQAMAEYAYAHFQSWLLGGSTDPAILARGVELARKATDVAPELPFAHSILGWMLVWSRHHDEGLAAMERAVQLDPHFAEGLARLSEAHMFAGNPGVALEYLKRARNRAYIEHYAYGFWAGEAYFYLNRHDEAVRELEASITKHPNFFPPRRFLAAVLVEQDRLEEARAQVRKVLELNPRVSRSVLRRQLPFKNPEDLERQLEALALAGLPE